MSIEELPQGPQLRLSIAILDGDKTVAQVSTDVPKLTAWRVYRDAIDQLLKPAYVLTLPDNLSEDDAKSLREKWTESFR